MQIDLGGYMLTIEESAQLLQVHPDTMRRWAREGKIPTEPLNGMKGSGFRIRPDDWVKQLEENEAPGQAKLIRLYVEEQIAARRKSLAVATGG